MIFLDFEMLMCFEMLIDLFCFRTKHNQTKQQPNKHGEETNIIKQRNKTILKKLIKTKQHNKNKQTTLKQK